MSSPITEAAQTTKLCKTSTLQTTGIRYGKLVPVDKVGLRLPEYLKILQQR